GGSDAQDLQLLSRKMQLLPWRSRGRRSDRLHWKRACSDEGSRIRIRLLPTSEESTIAATAHGSLRPQGLADLDRRHLSVPASVVSRRIRQEMPGRSQRAGVRIA